VDQGVRSVLGILPKPLPDELLYSLLARIRAYLGVSATTRWVEELFGHPVQIQIDMPVHIGALVSRFPPGNTLTAEELVDRHRRWVTRVVSPMLGPAN
jgi:hypothetical protein